VTLDFAGLTERSISIIVVLKRQPPKAPVAPLLVALYIGVSAVTFPKSPLTSCVTEMVLRIGLIGFLGFLTVRTAIVAFIFNKRGRWSRHSNNPV